MNSKVTLISSIALLATLLIPHGLSAQAQQSIQSQSNKHAHYKVIDIGTLGGPTNGLTFGARIINRQGALAGGADTSVFDPVCGCNFSHAVEWKNGELTDLGTLPNGANSFAGAINSRGTLAGTSEDGTVDPATGLNVFKAVTWQDGGISNLGTLGGLYSLPNAINSRGQAAGGAENTIPDEDNFAAIFTGLPSPTQWHAALWRNGRIQDLGTLGDGPDSGAVLVNEAGQVDGGSYTSSVPDPLTGIPPIHAFFWENGNMTDIPTLGGVIASANGLNNRGQVVGTSTLSGELTNHPFSWYRGVLTDIGTFGGDNGAAYWVNDNGEVVGEADFQGDAIHHAFVWKNGVMKDLPPVGNAPCSNAFAINSRGQVSGNSTDCNGTGLGAVLWEPNGSTVDLNSFIPPNSGITFNESVFVGDGGEIAVEGALNGVSRYFILVPDGDCDDACLVSLAASRSQVVPNLRSSIPGFGSPSADRGYEVRSRVMQLYRSPIFGRSH